MREVTKENLIAQIDRLRKIKDEQGQLSMNGEYTLQAYEMLLATMEAEPVENHIGSKNSLDAIVSFIKSKSNPTVKCYEEVSEQLFKDNCHGIHSHVIEYILKLGEELEDLRAEQDEIQSAPVATTETISFDEWSRKCALQITLCYPDFREKAKYIWDSARETQQLAPAPVVPEEKPIPNTLSMHAMDAVAVIAEVKGWNACRAAMLNK